MQSFVRGSFLLGLLSASVAAGCGDSGTTGSGGGNTGGSGSGGNTTTTNSGGNGTGGDATNAGGGGTGGGSGCTKITLDNFHASVGRDYTALVATPIGGANADAVDLEFYTAGTMTWSGAIDLGTAENMHYETCTTCLRVFEDVAESTNDPFPTIYFQTGGTVDLGSATLTDADDSAVYIPDGQLINVHLVEVTIDPDTSVSTPVPDGKCLDIVSAPLVVPAPPAGWNCDPTAYNDTVCDCGCGAVDLDCDDATKASCAICDDNGSCDDVGCSDAASTINATNNAVCDAG